MATDFTNTLNLPATEFSMRANLPAREPETLAYWQQIGLYRLMLENAAGKPTFELHDGPPFSNGNIHMGTALNKVLKDFINKSKTMEGYRVPYVPGWDNHRTSWIAVKCPSRSSAPPATGSRRSMWMCRRGSSSGWVSAATGSIPT